MAYFPFFADLSGREGLIAGGGRVALSKARRLLPYGVSLTVVAPEINPELAELPGVRTVRRPFAPGDVTDGLALVIAAADSPAVNREIAALCVARRIPVNVPGAPELCTFYFPALLLREPLSVGVSTGGASPAAAAYLRDRMAEQVPESAGEILSWLGGCREAVRARTDRESERRRIYRALFAESLRLGRPLTETETDRILSGTERGAP